MQHPSAVPSKLGSGGFFGKKTMGPMGPMRFLNDHLGGGFKYLLCSPLLWGRFPILTHIFHEVFE